ncbi:restriction endonuclease [Promicromonospora sp. NPDC050880]|uniref:restriction endonuclease n=1 Tax=Promicromonospora sp. NPDC050880 TaxID=3364406 RepID=UPI0037ADC400
MWQMFERAVAQVVVSLGSEAVVEHNARMFGELSRTQRQIDVLVTGALAAYPVSTAIECKHHKAAVTIDVVESFIGKLQDVGIGSGVIFSTSGFTAPAERRAAGSRFPTVQLKKIPREMFLDEREVSMGEHGGASTRFKMERVGPGGKLVVLENPWYFDYAREALRREPGGIGLVACGSGFMLSSMFQSMDPEFIAEIVYFGDVDVQGLRMPIVADRAARQAGLPPVRPAVGLYEALLASDRTEPAGGNPVSQGVAADLASWLAPKHRVVASDILRSGRRLWQETVLLPAGVRFDSYFR